MKSWHKANGFNVTLGSDDRTGHNNSVATCRACDESPNILTHTVTKNVACKVARNNVSSASVYFFFNTTIYLLSVSKLKKT